MRGVNVSMTVRGKIVRKINHGGNTYLPVTNGDVFKLKIQNDTNKRVLAVVSVDGRNVVNGQAAQHKGPGYVIERYSNVEIDGYRVRHRQGDGSDDTTSFSKEFRVGYNDTGQTYADKATGSTKNNGVIGVVIVPEMYIPTSPRHIYTKDTTVPISSRSMGIDHDESPEREVTTSGSLHVNSGKRGITRSASVGTEMGNKQYSPIKKVEFNPDYSQKSVITLYYDTVESLRARGILPNVEPNPFPAEDDGLYCPEY